MSRKIKKKKRTFRIFPMKSLRFLLFDKMCASLAESARPKEDNAKSETPATFVALDEGRHSRTGMAFQLNFFQHSHVLFRSK